MRKPRRWPVVLGVMLCALGLFVLLSALIEAPAADVAAAGESRPIVAAELLPAVLPTLETAPQARAVAVSFFAFTLWSSLSLMLPLPVSGRDANGRVLRKRRYARSYYPVFKQELACG